MAANVRGRQPAQHRALTVALLPHFQSMTMQRFKSEDHEAQAQWRDADHRCRGWPRVRRMHQGPF